MDLMKSHSFRRRQFYQQKGFRQGMEGISPHYFYYPEEIQNYYLKIQIQEQRFRVENYMSLGCINYSGIYYTEGLYEILVPMSSIDYK